MSKILYIFNAADWDSRMPVADVARGQGHEVVIGLVNSQKARDTRYKVHELQQSGSNTNPISTLSLIRDIRRLIKHEQPDIVHSVTLKYGFMTGLAAAPFAQMRKIHTLAGLGYVFRGLGIGSKMLNALLRPVLKYALKRPNTTLIFQNVDDQNLMIDEGYAKASDTVLIKGSGVDIEKFSNHGSTCAQDYPLVLMPTRLIRDKGIDIFIEAAFILHEKGYNHVRFQIAGGLSKDNPAAMTQKEMEDIAVYQDGWGVEWLGRVEDMPALLAQATLVVYPSYYGEGIPRVLLEACAAGRAIVTTDHPGCREAIIHAEGGLLVPVKDAQATADAIEALLNDPPRREKMESRNRARAEAEFDIRVIAEQTAALYCD